MQENFYMISDAAKKVNVENHVLRYWEEELDLPIKRNEMGHRHYTKEDIERFIRIKQLKEQGIQLKAIRSIIEKAEKNGGKLPDKIFEEAKGAEQKIEETKGEDNKIIAIEIKGDYIDKNEKDDKSDKAEKKEGNLRAFQSKDELEIVVGETAQTAVHTDTGENGRGNKALRLQYLLKQMIGAAVKESGQEMCDEIKDSILKEMDYQFRQQEEREESREAERRKREDEHNKRLDELLRTKSRRDKRKKHSIF